MSMVNAQNFECWLPVKKGLANSVDPDQTASNEAVWSGASLFAILTSILWIPALTTNILFQIRTIEECSEF